MKANYEDKIPKKTSEVSLGTLYDMNKQIMMNEAALTIEEINQKKEKLMDWIHERESQRYFMMLCNELKDYTVFNIKSNPITIEMVQNMANDVFECACNRGEVVGFDLQPDKVWEIWIKVNDTIAAYYLFPYGAAVLEY